MMTVNNPALPPTEPSNIPPPRPDILDYTSPTPPRRFLPLILGGGVILLALLAFFFSRYLGTSVITPTGARVNVHRGEVITARYRPAPPQVRVLLCRGQAKTNCTVLATRVGGRQVNVRIPFNYPLGGAELVIRQLRPNGTLSGVTQSHRDVFVLQALLPSTPPPPPIAVTPSPVPSFTSSPVATSIPVIPNTTPSNPPDPTPPASPTITGSPTQVLGCALEGLDQSDDDVAFGDPSAWSIAELHGRALPALLRVARAAVTNSFIPSLHNTQFHGSNATGSCVGIGIIQKAAIGQGIDLTDGDALTEAQVNAIAERLRACTGRDVLPANPLVIPRASLYAIANRLQNMATPPTATTFRWSTSQASILYSTDTMAQINVKLYGAGNGENPQNIQATGLLFPYRAETFSGLITTYSPQGVPIPLANAGRHLVTLMGTGGGVTVVDGGTASALELRRPPNSTNMNDPVRLCWRIEMFHEGGVSAGLGWSCASELRNRNTIGPRNQLPACNP